MTRNPKTWPWWNLALIASLALNLLFAGAIATRFFFNEGRIERMAGTSYLHLIPRKFLATLDKERREELLGLLKSHREQYRSGQKATRASAENLAAVLENYDEARLRAVLGEFNKNSTDMIAISSTAATDFISRLTPEQRASLATHIRARARGGRKKTPSP